MFQTESHLWGLLCLPVYLTGHFPSLWHVQGSTSTGVFKGGCWPLTHSSLGLLFHQVKTDSAICIFDKALQEKWGHGHPSAVCIFDKAHQEKWGHGHRSASDSQTDPVHALEMPSSYGFLRRTYPLLICMPLSHKILTDWTDFMEEKSVMIVNLDLNE